MAVNQNPAVHGLIVQLPLDSAHKMDTELITNAVSPNKDVDGSVLTSLICSSTLPSPIDPALLVIHQSLGVSG